MFLLYLIVFVVFAPFIWLGIKGKWKTLIWSLAIFGLVVLIGWFIFLYFIAPGMTSVECEDSRSWVIENYTIKEKKCLGFAGPHYYPVGLYVHDKKIASLSLIPDKTCEITFITNQNDTLNFDICREVRIL